MTFDEYMSQFFKGYKPEQRAKVEADVNYQIERQNKDWIKAAEIAQTIIEGDIPNNRDRRLNEKYR